MNYGLRTSLPFTNQHQSVTIPVDATSLLFAVDYGSSKEDTMAGVIPEDYKDLFEKKAFANLATVNADGTPQVTPVWVDYDGDYVLVNSARGRRKDRNMERNRA